MAGLLLHGDGAMANLKWLRNLILCLGMPTLLLLAGRGESAPQDLWPQGRSPDVLSGPVLIPEPSLHLFPAPPAAAAMPQPWSPESQVAVVGPPRMNLPPVDRLQPAHPTFNSDRLDQQLRLYEAFLATSGPPDILIVGSSRSLQGVDPTALQQALDSQGQANLKIFNFGINGATAQVVDLLLHRILAPDQLPRLIIWADGSRAFNSGRPDITYNGIVASAGYARLAPGVYPIRLVRPSDLPTPSPLICIDLPPLPMGQIDEQYAADLDVMATAQPLASRQLAVTDLPCDRPLPRREPASAQLDRRLTGMATRAVAEAEGELDANGFQPISIRFDPASYYRQYPRVTGLYDTNYIPFELGGAQRAATMAIATLARQRQIPLVFVNLPLTADYLDPVRSDYEAQFLTHMTQLADQADFTMIDLSQQWPQQNDYFADPSHLNQFGARAVAVQLATHASIPWPRPRLRRSVSAVP